MAGERGDELPGAVLFVCTMNSVRSPMAAAILRHLAGRRLYVESAGVRAGGSDAFAVAAMEEIGIDISGHHSKHMNDFLHKDIETVVTVCGDTDQACPMFPGQLNRHHWGFDDPAEATGTDDEKLAVFRRVRDEIRRVFTAYAEGRRDQLKATK